MPRISIRLLALVVTATICTALGLAFTSPANAVQSALRNPAMIRTVAAAPSVSAPTGGFIAVGPARLVDTRISHTRRAARSTMAVQVLGLKAVPASGVSAVVLNITAVNPAAPGYLQAYPAGGARPTTSTVNYVRGVTVANQAIVTVGTGGKINVYTYAATDLVIDVTGYFRAGSSYSATTPHRLLDTRQGVVHPSAKSTMTLKVLGTAGVPSSGVAAVVLNFTVVNPSRSGFGQVFPTGANRPTTSTLNYDGGETVAGMAIATVGSGGRVSLYTYAAADLIVDVSAWIPAGTTYTAGTPVRMLDTRYGVGAPKMAIPAGGTVTLKIAGKQGIPAGVTAIEGNLTAVLPNRPGNLLAYPAGDAVPTTSVVNYRTGDTVANSTTLRVGANGSISIKTYSATNIIFDVTGYWTPGAPPTVTSVSIPQGIRGVPYQAQLTATGGTGDLAWQVRGLPAGLTATAQGVITGTPSITGTFQLVATATDERGLSATAAITLAVPTSAPAQCVGKACSVTSAGTNTIKLTAAQLAKVTRDPTTRRITGLQVRGVTAKVNDVVIVPVTTSTPSGAIAIVTRVEKVAGDVMLTVTPGTPAQAYNSGTVQTSGRAGQASVDNSGVTTYVDGEKVPNDAAVPTVAKLSCEGSVTAEAAISITPTITPTVSAVWKHPLIQIGQVYPGTGGLEMAYLALDGSVKVAFDASVSAKGKCSLKLPEIVRAVPAGDLGAVILDLAPTLTLNADGKVAVNTSTVLECSSSYYWYEGHGSPTNYCKPSVSPLKLTHDEAQATLTGHLNATVSLDDAAGITGDLSPVLTASATPLKKVVAELDGRLDASLGACLACFWKDSPAKVTIASGTIWKKVLWSLTTAPPDPGPARTNHVLVAGTGDEGDSTPVGNLVSILTSAGYQVDRADSVPDDLSTYSAVFYIDTNPLDDGEVASLLSFIESGHGVYLTGERPCCEALNAADEQLAQSVLTTDSNVQVGGLGDPWYHSGDIPVLSSAPGNSASQPFTLSSIPVDAPGALGNVSTRNIWAEVSSDSDGNYVPVGAVWDRSDVRGSGRLAVVMDINWLEHGDSSVGEAAQDLALFLTGLSGPPARVSAVPHLVVGTAPHTGTGVR